MFERMSVWRLRHFADECQRARNSAVDPLTREELDQFEKLFRELARDIQRAQEGTTRAGATR